MAQIARMSVDGKIDMRIVCPMGKNCFFLLLCGAFLLYSCSSRGILYVDEETQVAGQPLVQAWKGAWLSGREEVLVRQPFVDTDKDLKSRSPLPSTVILGNWATSNMVQNWTSTYPQVHFCVLMPRESLPPQVTALFPDRKEGWKKIVEYAAHTRNPGSAPALALFGQDTPDDLQESLKNRWNELQPGIPWETITVTPPQIDDPGTLRRLFPSQISYLFLLTGKGTSKLLKEFSHLAPVAVEFPPEDAPPLWTVSLVLDEDGMESLFSKKTFPGENKEVFLPLKIKVSSR